MADKRRNLGIPSGVVFPFAGTTAPYGYLVCDGSAISRSEYPALFVSLGSGTLHGVGDGLTTFNLPDYRGKFMRGLDGVAGNDPDKTTRTHPKTGAVVGNVVGSVQDHANESHRHHMFNAATGAVTDNAAENYIAKNPNGNTNYFSYAMTSLSGSVPAHGLTESIGGSESRPKNVNVNYIVKV